MNSLEIHIAANKLDELQVMNWLQDHAWISDNAVHARDVAEVDAVKVVAGLKDLREMTVT